MRRHAPGHGALCGPLLAADFDLFEQVQLDATALSQLFQVEILLQLTAQGADPFNDLLCGTSFKLDPVARFGQSVGHEHVHGRPCGGKSGLKSVPSLPLQKRIGIVPTRQFNDHGRNALFLQDTHRLESRLAAGGILIKQQHRPLHVTLENMSMIHGQSRTAGGDDLGKACPLQSQLVEITFDQQNFAALAHGLARLIKTEQHLPFVVNR